MKFIPNTLTALNLCLGVLGIIFACREAMSWAAYCIFAAAILDFLDGLVARLLNAHSDIGKELDSLADMVSFGALPGVIVFQFIAINRGLYFEFIERWTLTDVLFCSVALLIPAAAALRLARFNNDEVPRPYFQGMPTPAVAILVSSFPLILESQFRLNIYDPQLNLIFTVVAESQRWEWLQFLAARLLFSDTFFLVLSPVLAALMLVELPMIALKFKGLSWGKNKWIYIFAIWLVLVWVLFVIPYVFWIPINYTNIDFISIPIAWLGYVVLSVVYATFGHPNKRIIEVE